MYLSYILGIPVTGFELLLFLIAFLIWCVALVAVANGKFYDPATKICWFFLILFLNIAGVVLFIFWGRKEINYGKHDKQ